MLIEEGYSVSVLSRDGSQTISGINFYQWNVRKGVLDKNAITQADHIINLAGSPIADGRWTNARKKEIRDSRIMSTRLLAAALQESNHKVKTFVGTSAIGYYGNRGSQWLLEDEPAGKDFLAQVCREWEAESLKIATLNIRTVILRMGIVLSRQGGALPELEKTLRFGLASYLGTGDQYNSWIHIDDACRMYIRAIKSSTMSGIYNAVAPSPVANFEMIKEIRSAKKSPALMLPAPVFALKAILGEMSEAVLFSQRCSAQKIQRTGFEFRYGSVHEALKNLYA